MAGFGARCLLSGGGRTPARSPLLCGLLLAECSAHGVTGVSVRAMMYAICKDGSSRSHLAPGPVLLHRYTTS